MVDLQVKYIWSFTSKPTEKSPSIVDLDVFRKESFLWAKIIENLVLVLKNIDLTNGLWKRASKFNGEIRTNRWIWGMEDSLQDFGPLSSEWELKVGC